MTTKNIVPQADNEGQLGTATKRFANAYLANANIDNLSGSIASANSASTATSASHAIIADSALTVTSASYATTASYAVSSAGALLNIVEDTTPQLGGNLDTNSFTIDSMISSSAQLASDISGSSNSLSSSLAGRIVTNDDEITKLQATASALITDYTTVQSVGTADSVTFDSMTITSSLIVSESLSVHHIDFTDGVDAPYSSGRMFYNDTDSAVSVYSDLHSGSLQIGQEHWLKAVNKTTSIITNGTSVYISGSQGNRPTIAPTDMNLHNASLVIGLTTHDVAVNAEGYVTTQGLVRDVDTSTFIIGDQLYVSGSSGSYSNAQVPTPAHSNFIGYVITAHNTQGIIFVSPTLGDELSDMHDVCACVDDFDGNILVYDSTNNLWSGSVSRDFILDSSSNVGIGTILPATGLHV